MKNNIQNTSLNDNDQVTKRVINVSIKIGILALLIFMCIVIIKPFIYIFIWGAIIAITLYPLFDWIRKKLNSRSKLSGILLTLVLLAILIVPTYFLADSLVEGIRRFGADLQAKNFTIAVPPENVKEWPVIGKSLYSTWLAASKNLANVASKYESQLLAIGQWLLNTLLGAGLGFVQILVSIIIAGILLISSDKGSEMSRNLFRKLVGERGREFASATELTIRNVSKGVIGVAVLQSLLLGILFFAAGVPYAGLWALFCLILAVIQVGPLLITLPVIIYLFATIEPWAAIIWTILIVLGTLLDNILKPILMGKGAPAPMLIIFLGAIGGFITSGFIGLFIGAIILSLGYKLFIIWVNSETIDEKSNNLK